MRGKMDKKDKKDILFHLTIIGFFLLFIFSSCSTFYFWKNGDPSDMDRTRRYMITEKDLAQFTTTVRPRKQDLDSLYRQACYFQRIKKHKLALQVLEELILADLSYVKAYNAMGIRIWLMCRTIWDTPISCRETPMQPFMRLKRPSTWMAKTPSITTIWGLRILKKVHTLWP
jgi:hypothetical protein